jgi:hypothetical protein
MTDQETPRGISLCPSSFARPPELPSFPRGAVQGSAKNYADMSSRRLVSPWECLRLEIGMQKVK